MNHNFSYQIPAYNFPSFCGWISLARMSCMQGFDLENEMTKYIQLSGKHKDKQLIVDDEDYDEMSKYSWYLMGRGYPSTTIKAHQMIMKAHKRDGEKIVDHINGNTLDVRKSNLRFVTNVQNSRNTRMFTTNKAGYKGVVKRKNNTIRPYAAFIGRGGKRGNIYLGSYETAEEAARVYDKAAKKYFGEFARLNFPDKHETNI